MHVHVSVLDWAIVGAYVVIFLFVWRLAASKLAKREEGSVANSIGAAMGSII